MPKLISFSAIPGLLLFSFAVTGCSFLRPGKTSSTEKTPVVRATVESPAVRVMGLWQPGEGDGLDGSVGRGFVGQIYFFNASSPSPVAVDGDVRIYVFDDVGSPEERKKPIHQFDFNDGAWQGYETTSALGPCYNVYVPYTRKGQLEADCSLRLRLTRPDGSNLFSEMNTVHLQGISREDSVARRIRSTPEYDLNAPTKKEWQGQATTIGVQKGGRFERVSDSEQAAAAAYFQQSHVPGARLSDGQSSLSSGESSAAPQRDPQNLNQQEQIRALEQKLIELYAERKQTARRNSDEPQRSYNPQATEPELTPPRRFEPPDDAQQLGPQAQFRPLSASRQMPEYVEYQEPEQIQRLSYEAPPSKSRDEAATQARVDELRAILGSD